MLLLRSTSFVRLKTHKLKGELKGSLACSAGYDCRIVFSFVHHEGAEAILLETIGTHEEVYKPRSCPHDLSRYPEKFVEF